MRSYTFFFPALLMLAACGSLQETAQVRDDVYDIPDRTVVASVAPVPEAVAEEPAKASDDYYNSKEATRYDQGSYWNQTYNDPRWYNQGRFGFGYSMNSWGGSGFGTNYNNGMGCHSSFNSPTGSYDPYWSNSWQSGYGANNPYGYYNPWSTGYYDPWGYSSPWGCNNYGYGGCNSLSSWYYDNGYGNSCYNGYGSNYYGGGGYYNGWGQNGYGSGEGTTHIIAHRPSMTGGGAGSGITVSPRAPRGISLLPPPPVRETPQDHDRIDRNTRPDRPTTFEVRERPAREEKKDRIEVPVREERKDRTTRPRQRDRERPSPDHVETPRVDRPNRDNGGGSTPSPSPSPSPRPRR
jgi:hypothetical protein